MYYLCRMRYRMLSREELTLFEEDLKAFLIVNGIHADEWEQMNTATPEKAIELVELFSDTVLQKVYQNIRFIEHRTTTSCMVFYLKPDEIELISINARGKGINLSTPTSIHNALSHNAKQLSVFKTQKAYSKVREDEIHELLEQGCVNSSEAFWYQLDKIL